MRLKFMCVCVLEPLSCVGNGYWLLEWGKYVEVFAAEGFTVLIMYVNLRDYASSMVFYGAFLTSPLKAVDKRVRDAAIFPE